MRDRPLQLMLVDEDPAFRLGLKVWLEQQGDFAVIAEAGKAEEALKGIRSRFEAHRQQQKADPDPEKPSRRGWRRNSHHRQRTQPQQALPALPPIDLVLLDLGMGADGLDNRPGLQICEQIKAEFPTLPVLVLSAEAEPTLQAAAERAGASGYGTRSMSVRLLAQLICKAATEPYVASTVTDRDGLEPPAQTQNAQIQNAQIQNAQIQNAQSPIAVEQFAASAPTYKPANPSPANPQPASSTTVRSQANPTAAPIDPTQASSTQSVRSQPEQPQSASVPSAPPPPRQPPRQKNSAALSRLDDIPGPLTAMRISMRLSGLQQIDRNLAAVEAAKQQTASWLNRAVLDGKKRELNAARWLVASIWRTPQFSDAGKGNRQRRTGRGSALSNQPTSTDWIRIAQQGGYSGNYADMTAARYLDRDSLIPNAAAVVAATTARLQARPSEIQNVVFEGVFAKLQGPLKNVTQDPLEIDILRADKKLELLYLVLRQLEELLADLRESNVQAGQLNVRAPQVVEDLWDVVNTEFFGKYYTVRVSNVEEEVVALLQREKPIVETQILNKIPMVAELLGHWLFQEPMEIDSTAYEATSPRAIARSERLLENLVIQVANAIVQPLLNRLSDTESIKKSLYTSRLMSSREIERFRNNLSWRYRKNRIVDEPKAIFESRYNLYVLNPNGIDATSIYAPRRAELDRLRGLPLIVTLALETRDAIAPRLRTAFSFVGSSVVYVLTEVLGRGIGLVGRGVLKGVGNIRQDGKNRQRRRSESSSDYQDETYQGRDYREETYKNDAYVENPYSQEFNEWE